MFLEKLLLLLDCKTGVGVHPVFQVEAEKDDEDDGNYDEGNEACERAPSHQEEDR